MKEKHYQDIEGRVRELDHSKFQRDVETLYHQYEPFRMKLFNKYKTNFNDEESRNQLMSYIDEQFIRLVKEYEIDSPVDFPGYIKRKLPARITGSYIRAAKRDRTRETTLKKEEVIHDLLEADHMDVGSLYLEDILQHVFIREEPSPLMLDILQGWLEYKTDTELIRELAEKHEVTLVSVEDTMEVLRNLFETRMESY